MEAAPSLPAQEAYTIEGGRPVRGEITCLGAKNFVTKAMVAALLADTPTTLTNVPEIGDVTITVELLESIGATVTRDGDTMVIDPRPLSKGLVSMPQTGTNRIPVLLMGPLLHRFGQVSVPMVGGCKIGARKVDFHLNAMRSFGATVEEAPEALFATREKRLKGTRISLPFPSVGATETCLFLGALAEGRTIIENAATEPEISELITMLRLMGAVIFTRSGRDIRIEGVPRLSGTRMEVIGDRIEAGSWAALACASKGDITVHGIRPYTLGNFFSYLRQIGGSYELVGRDSIRFYREGTLKAASMETDVYPGFSTDWQQPFGILFTQAEGVSTIHETVYENRFGYLEALQQLGAKTQLSTHCLGSLPCRFKDENHHHSAIIVGPTPFHAVEEITIPDLRAGLAYVIAAAIAEGTTTLTGIDYLERGYGDIVPRMQAMNLGIEKVRLTP